VYSSFANKYNCWNFCKYVYGSWVRIKNYYSPFFFFNNMSYHIPYINYILFYPTTNIWNLIFVLMYFVNSNNILPPPPPQETFSIPPRINICICTWLKDLRKVWLYTSNAPHIDDHCILLNAFKTQKVNMARPCRCMMGMELPWSLQQIMPTTNALPCTFSLENINYSPT